MPNTTGVSRTQQHHLSAYKLVTPARSAIDGTQPPVGTCAEDDQAVGYVEQLSQPFETDSSRELRRKVSMEGTAHVGHRQLPRVVLEESPFELRALEVCLDLVRCSMT